MKAYLKYLFQLILSPRNGWEDIEKADMDPSRLLSAGYYPLIGVAAASVFVRALFYPGIDFMDLFVSMVEWFVVYFVGFFFGVFSLSLFLEPMVEGHYDEDRVHTFVLYTLGLEAIINIIFQCLPVSPLVLFFLPCYVALVQYKGVAFMRVRPEQQGLFMLLAIFGVLLPPYIFYYIFSSIL